MCFDLWFTLSDFIIAMHPWLSSKIFIGASGVHMLKSSNNRVIHITSSLAWHIEIYSASVEDRATVVCFLLIQLTYALPNLNTNPLVDFRSFIFPPQSASAKPTNFHNDPGSSFNLWSIVPFKYLKTFLTAFQSHNEGSLTFLHSIPIAAAISGLVVIERYRRHLELRGAIHYLEVV